MSDIAAVIVTHNRKDLLQQCLMHILSGSIVPDILVTDNGSTDGTQETLKPLIADGRVIYFNTGTNLGGAGGFNFGIRRAVELGYKYLWIMDDDCMPRAGALEALMQVDSALGSHYGFLSSRVLWKDGMICRMNVQRVTLTKNVTDFSIPMQRVVMASFVSLFVRADIVRELGLPIKEFFIWTDDWEYTRRISRNYPCYLIIESVVEHHSQSNIAADIANEFAERLDRFKYLYRNDVVLYRREGLKGFCYELARLLAHSARVIVKGRNHRLSRLSVIFIGTWKGLRFHPTIEYIEGEKPYDTSKINHI